MAHIHVLPGGQETTTERIDPNAPGEHWHLVDGRRTSTTPFGPGHVHTFDGQRTGGPVNVNSKLHRD